VGVCVYVGFVMNVYFDNCVGILVIYVLVFTVFCNVEQCFFIFSFYIYMYLFLFPLSVLT